MSEMETREGHTPGSALVSPMLEDLWAMRTTVANYFGGESADREVQDLNPGEVQALYIEIVRADAEPRP